MSQWIVKFTPSADRAFGKLPREVQGSISHALRRYAETGAGKVIHLTNRPGEYRLRVGDYRVVFERQGDHLVILVLKAGHRGDVYRD